MWVILFIGKGKSKSYDLVIGINKGEYYVEIKN